MKKCKIIAIANQKGGAGKTTIATNVATALTTHQKGVLFVDADPQGSATDWASMNEEYLFPTVAINSGNIGKQISMMLEKGNYDLVIIDCAPRMESEMASIISIADLVVIPCMPSPLDLWAAESLVEMITTRQHLTGKPKAQFLLNGTHPLSKIQADVLESMADYGLECFDQSIAARTSYRRIMNEGKSVIFSEDIKASAEIHNLTNEILEVIHGIKQETETA